MKKEDLIARHQELLKLNNIKNIWVGTSAIFCEDRLEELEKALSNCNKALLNKNYVPFLPCPGEGWSVSIDPDHSVEIRGRGFVEVEFLYGNNHPNADFCHIPTLLYKNLIEERYSNLKSENYYPNGQLKRDGNYLSGEREGLWIEYHENGNLKSKGHYSKGSKIETWEYYYESGKIKKRKDFEEPIYMISELHWFENGQIKGDWDVDKESATIKSRWYFETGELRSESTKSLDDKYLDGEHPTYFKNGHLNTVIVTEKDRIIQYRYYNPDGSIKRINES